jgi:hypothetical protein
VLGEAEVGFEAGAHAAGRAFRVRELWDCFEQHTVCEEKPHPPPPGYFST